MAKNGKTIAEMRAENPNFDRDLERTFHMAAQQPRIDIASLVKQHQEIKAYVEMQQKSLSDFLRPYVEQMEKIHAAITAAMTEQGIKSLKTDYGTPILSEIDASSIDPEHRDDYIDLCLENWDEFGGEMLQIGAPKVTAVRAYMDSHGGQLPPHVKMTTTLRFSIRKA